MSAGLRAALALAGLLLLSGSTCTSNFTEQDIVKDEMKQAEAAKHEEKLDDELGQQGGENEQEIREQIDDIDGGSGADF